MTEYSQAQLPRPSTGAVRPWVLVVSVVATALLFGACGVGLGALGGGGQVQGQPAVTTTITGTVTETQMVESDAVDPVPVTQPTPTQEAVAPPVEPPSGDPTAAMQEAVTDDEVTYVVSSVDCSAAALGSAAVADRVCVVSFNMTNDKDRVHEFDPGDVEAYFGSSVVQPDEFASAALLADATVLVARGQTVPLSIAFPVSEDSPLTAVRFTTDVVSLDGAVVRVS